MRPKIGACTLTTLLAAPYFIRSERWANSSESVRTPRFSLSRATNVCVNTEPSMAPPSGTG